MIKSLLLSTAVLFLAGTLVMAQNSIQGRVFDESGAPLPFASVVITHSVESGTELALKTQLGSTSDMDGYYVLTSVPDGSYIVKVIYMGYDDQSFRADLGGAVRSFNQDVNMKSQAHEIEEVVVTMQAKGQMAAINQQVNALTIKNVVSSDRIQQNPDANAAEALGRLPGVTVTRSGGEANGIVVRGMQGYNNVTINGVEVPVNLTSISQYALQNVEVFKSITADMDAAAPAGSVNLQLGTAPNENSTRILAQGGYNNLNNTYTNYKFNVSSNWRFMDKKLGLSLNLASEATDRSTEQLIAEIGLGNVAVNEGDEVILQNSAVKFRDTDRTVKRNSAILTTDYRFSPSASIEWSNIVTHSPGGALHVDNTYGADGSSRYYIEDHKKSTGYNYSSILTAKHLLGRIKVDYSASFGYANNYGEYRTANIINKRAFETPLSDLEKQTLSHQEFVSMAQMENTTEAINQYNFTNDPHAQPNMNHSTTETKNTTIDTRINMELPYTIGGLISGSLKWGGRYKRQNNEQEKYNVNRSSHRFPFVLMGTLEIPREDGSLWNDDINISPEHYDEYGHISGSYLLDQGNYNDNFLNSGYAFGWYPNMGRVNEVLDWWDGLIDYAFDRGIDYWQPLFGQIEHVQMVNFNENARGTGNYFVDHYAAYVMTEMRIGKNLHFVPGVRFEKSHYDMNSFHIFNTLGSRYELIGHPVNAAHDNDFFLPMVQLKYEPLRWLHGLFSYTETLKRPGANLLSPMVFENQLAYTYTSGNPNLMPEHWTSIDFGIAAHSGKIGLFSVNLFYKKVEDKIEHTYWTKMSTDTDIEVGSFAPEQRVGVRETQNHPYDGFSKGIEVEWQTNFWYLPKPFSYFTLNLNYSYIDNKTTYVYESKRDSLIGEGRWPVYESVSYDKLVEGPMTNQPTHLFNGQLGFSYKKFETYLSYQYIGDVFMQKTILQETDVLKTSFHRLDWQAKYELPLKGLEVMISMANITDTQEVKKRRGDDRPISIERYGWTADIGLRYTF